MSRVLAVSQGEIAIFVSPGGAKPSPLPLVTLELVMANRAPTIVELTPGQADMLISALQVARRPFRGERATERAAVPGIDPEGT